MTGHLCSLWHEPLYTAPKAAGDSYLVYSPRAGGVYVLEGEWAQMASRDNPIGLLNYATPRQKANLSYWIYRQNLESGLLVPDHRLGSQRHTAMSMFSADDLA